MHFINKYSIIAFISFVIFGCTKTYVQVFKSSTDLKKSENGLYVFENDSLRISYSFWASKGVFSFSIYNKLDKPLYIDWKKSSYIDNQVKLDYWNDQETNSTSSAYGSYLYSGPLLKAGIGISKGVGVSVSTLTKQERITFIPPRSYHYNSQFYIYTGPEIKKFPNTETTEVPRNDNPKKLTIAETTRFDENSTPISFRNFLTFSTSEEFEQEFYIDNSFFIQEILTVENKHFEAFKLDSTKRGRWFIEDENGDPIKLSFFEDPTRFYKRLPKY